MSEPEEGGRLEGALIILEVVIVWQEFKRNHDLESAKLQCCETSKMFFDKMDELERLIMQPHYEVPK